MNDKIEIERKNLDNFIADTIKEVSIRSFDDGLAAGINSVNDTFKKLKEKQGDSRFTISEISKLIDSMTLEIKKGLLESYLENKG